MTPTLFGQTPDGEDVHRVTISDGNLTASVLSWAALLQDLRLDGHDQPLVEAHGVRAGRARHHAHRHRHQVDARTHQRGVRRLGAVGDAVPRLSLTQGPSAHRPRIDKLELKAKNSIRVNPKRYGSR